MIQMNMTQIVQNSHMREKTKRHKVSGRSPNLLSCCWVGVTRPSMVGNTQIHY